MAVILKANPMISFANKQDFLDRAPPYSIAVDGCIKGEQTFRVPEGPYANFDHHYGSDDIATRSSFMQLYLEIKQGGLVERFSKNKELHVRMYADHGDEDVSGCYWALKNADKIIKNENERIRNLVNLCDKLDTTSGSFDTGDTVLRRRMAWMFKPYHDVRYGNQLWKMDSAKLEKMIKETERRISEYVCGGGEEVELKGGYEIIGANNKKNKKNGWTFTKELNPSSRMIMYLDGINTFASLVGTKGRGKFSYIFGKKTDWDTGFDLPRLYNRLNIEEGRIINKKNLWGGTRMRGGSPKISGSGINPKRFEEIINEEIDKLKTEKDSHGNI